MAVETMVEDELLTAEEVAAIYKVTPNTVYQMRQRGILEAVDLGIGSVRFRRSDVMARIAKRQEREKTA